MLETVSGRTRRRLSDVVLEVAEAQRPGTKIVTRLRRNTPALMSTMRRRLVRTFTELGEHVAAVAAEHGGLLIEASHAEAEQIDRIIASAALNEWRREHVFPAFEDHWNLVGESTVSALAAQDVTPVHVDRLMQRVLQEGGRRAGLIDVVGDTKLALFRALEKGREEGLNPRDTARAIRAIVPEGRFTNAGVSYRAELIARTETLHAQRFASLETFRADPHIVRVVAFDGDSDEECAARDGVEFSLDDAEVEMMSTHPNCVLAFGPVAA